LNNSVVHCDSPVRTVTAQLAESQLAESQHPIPNPIPKPIPNPDPDPNPIPNPYP